MTEPRRPGRDGPPNLWPPAPAMTPAYPSRAVVGSGVFAFCARCRSPLTPRRYRGNPRKWCSERCRVATYYEARGVAVGGVERRCEARSLGWGITQAAAEKLETEARAYGIDPPGLDGLIYHPRYSLGSEPGWP